MITAKIHANLKLKYVLLFLNQQEIKIKLLLPSNNELGACGPWAHEPGVCNHCTKHFSFSAVQYLLIAQ